MGWGGSRCGIEGLLKGGAEVGGVAEELEWPHGRGENSLWVCVVPAATFSLDLFKAAALWQNWGLERRLSSSSRRHRPGTLCQEMFVLSRSKFLNRARTAEKSRGLSAKCDPAINLAPSAPSKPKISNNFSVEYMREW